MEYTLIGDDVNLAKRVESTAQGDMLMVSEALLARDSRVRVLGTSFNPISLKGKSLQYVLASVRGVATEDGYLLSIPATLDGQTGKITFCNHAGDHFKFVCATPITLGDRALQLQIVERPDEAPVTVTVSQAAEGPFYDFVCQERPAYLQLMMDQGLVDGGREIDWKR